MKKYIYILTAFLLGTVSCSVDGPSAPEQKENDGKVTLMMKVTLPEPIEVTKGAMADQPIIDNLYVAVFGGEGYLNDYTRAVRCNADGTGLSQDWSGITNGSEFYFKVTLTATQSLRHLHIIANGPEQLDFNTYENELMQHLITTGTKGAYWQYFDLPNGTVKADGENPSDELKAAFDNIKLIRNFAKINVTLDTEKVKNFRLTGFRVYNTTTAGSIAIWDGSKYMSNYNSYTTVSDLYSVYPNGFIPIEAGYDQTAPSTTQSFDTNPKYVYERPKGTSDNGPYIIIKGRFKEEGKEDFDTEDTYYRIDFVDRDGVYLPLYRNFAYNITLTSVAKRGVADPSAALASNSNVSSLKEAESLSDIADGVSRLHVLWLDKTYMSTQDNVAFRYQYIVDVATNTHKKAEFSTPTGNAITVVGNNWATGGGDLDSEGWGTVYFDVAAPETGENAKEKVSTFTVTGKTADGQKLYRNITIHVLPAQNFGTATVSSEGSAIGSKVTVNITLPQNLPSSVFPLQILFEDTNRALNPYGNDMPVKIGNTIITGQSGTSYQFNKSISYLDYLAKTDNKFDFVFKRVKTGATQLYYKSEFIQPGNVRVNAN
ncbi:MAG: hypothetical protein IJ202_00930 [Bacteroidales bacterium]|nr:hypothetical protein [Bacteroidales bacterium]